MSLVKRVSDGRRVAKPTQAPHAGASYTVRALRVLSFCDLFLCPPAYCCSYFALKRMDKKKIILMKQLDDAFVPTFTIDDDDLDDIMEL